MPPCPDLASPMDWSLEPAYLNLPGWRCIPVYALPLSPTASSSSSCDSQNLMPSSIPPDPLLWTRQNVSTWLDWCVDQFSLPSIDVDKFHMNGRGLCLLRRTDFCERAPRCGDVLFNALQLLMRPRERTSCNESNGAPQPSISASLLQHASQEKGAIHATARSGWPRSISSDFHSVGHVIHEGNSDADSTTASSPPITVHSEDPSPEDTSSHNSKQSFMPTSRLSQYDSNMENSVEKINVRLLWDFLQQLLNDSQQRYTGCIIWKDKARGIFKITDPHWLAALWGKQKNHLNMNFDKMSRALRYYYRVRILQKEPGERHCYRFLRHPSELRHCKQRALLTKDAENIAQNGISECTDLDSALDMSIKEENTLHADVD